MRRPFNKSVLAGIVGVLVILVVNAGLAYWNTRQMNEGATRVDQTRAVIGLTRNILTSLVDAETGQRGFLLTGKDDFLQPYRAAVGRLSKQLTELKGKTKDNPGQQDRSGQLDELTTVFLARLLEGIDLHRKGLDEDQALLAVKYSKQQMDEIRNLMAEIETVSRRGCRKWPTRAPRC